jgi:hypothetical protein
MTVGEFWEAWKAYQDEKLADRRHMGELARGMAARILNPFCKGAIREVDRFWPMPWDERAADDAETRRLEALPPEEKQLEARKFLERIGLDYGEECTESQG